MQVYIEYLNRGLGTVQTGLNTVDQKLATISKTAEMLDTKLRKVDQTLAGWQRTAALIAGAGVGGLGLVMREGIKVHAMFERINLSLEVMLKSKQAADAMMRDMVKFAATTPFSLLDLSKAVNQLVSFRVEAGNVIPYLRTIGQAAATMKVPIEQAIDAMMRLRSGIYQPRMLVPLGINRELLREYGVEFGKQGQLLSSGEEAFQAALQTMEDQFGGLFGRINETIDGLLNNLGDLIDRIWDYIGETLSEKFKSTVTRINDVLGGLIDSERMKAAIKGSMDALLGELEPYIDRALDWLEQLIGYLEQNPRALVDGMRAFVEVLKNVVAVVLTLTAARGLLALIMALTSIASVLTGGWAAAIGVAAGIGLIALFNMLRAEMDALGPAVQPASQRIKELSGELQTLAEKEEEARRQMDEAATALRELEDPARDAAATQDELTAAQTRFTEGKDAYVGAIDAQIGKLQELKEALAFQLTPENVLAELQEQAKRGFAGGAAPITAEQFEFMRQERLYQKIGQELWRQAGTTGGSAAQAELLKRYGLEPMRILGGIESVTGREGMGIPIGIRWEDEARLGMMYMNQLIQSEGRVIADQVAQIAGEQLLLETKRQYPLLPTEAQRHLLHQYGPVYSAPPVAEGEADAPGGFAASLGLPPASAEALARQGKLTPQQEEAIQHMESLRQAAKQLVEATQAEVIRLQKKQELTGDDQQEAILTAQAAAYEQAYVNQLQRFIEEATLEQWADAHRRLTAATEELAAELEAEKAAVARERRDAAQQSYRQLLAQLAGDERGAARIEAEGLVAEAQEALQDLAFAADPTAEELLQLQTAAYAAVGALISFASALAGMDEKVASYMRGIAEQYAAALDAMVAGGADKMSLAPYYDTAAQLASGGQESSPLGGGFYSPRVEGGTSAGTWEKID